MRAIVSLRAESVQNPGFRAGRLDLEHHADVVTSAKFRRAIQITINTDHEARIWILPSARCGIEAVDDRIARAIWLQLEDCPVSAASTFGEVSSLLSCSVKRSIARLNESAN